MLRKILLMLALAGCLSLNVAADPIGWQQLARGTTQQQALVDAARDGSAAQTRLQEPAPSQSGDDMPRFITLPDGRIVPYGAGVICDENCVQGVDETVSRRPIFWYVAIPAAIGGVVAVLSSRGRDTVTPDRGRPILFDDPGGTPKPTPPPSSNVPEPATLILLGAGLAIIGRRVRQTTV